MFPIGVNTAESDLPAGPADVWANFCEPARRSFLFTLNLSLGLSRFNTVRSARVSRALVVSHRSA